MVGSLSAQTLDGKPGFQITGNLNAGYVSQNYFGNKVSGFEQNGMGTSNIYLRGLEDLGGGMKAHWMHGTDIQFMTMADQGQMYTATNAGAVGTYGNDQKMVGLTGGFGTVNFGTINNQTLYGGVVLLNPIWGTSYSGGYGSTIVADPTGSIVRYNNTMEYKSPAISGFQLFYQTSAKQNKAVNTNYTGTLGALNVPGMTEVSLKYSNGPIIVQYTDLATDATGVATATTAATKKGVKTLTGAYDLGNGLRLAALNQKVDNGTLLAFAVFAVFAILAFALDRQHAAALDEAGALRGCSGPALLPHLSVAEHLELARSLASEAVVAEARVAEARVSLKAVLHRRPRHLDAAQRALLAGLLLPRLR